MSGGVRGVLASALRHRPAVAVVAILVTAAPAVAFSAPGTDAATPLSSTPFCDLSPEVRRSIVAGFYDGRSPDVIPVFREQTMGGTIPGPQAGAAPWIDVGEAPTVPIVFAGAGVERSDLGPTSITNVAPTIARLIGLELPFPDVRVGRPLPIATTQGAAPRLIVLIAVRGLDSAVLTSTPGRVGSIDQLRAAGASTLLGTIDSVPADPAAVVTTLGTGGLPSEHGITGSFIRTSEGAVVRPWSRSAPTSVIATLADDMDEVWSGEPRIGLVASDPTDRGLIGGDWYPEQDRDDILPPTRSAEALERIQELLADGYGADEVPDLIGVVLDGRLGEIDSAVGEIREAVGRMMRHDALVVLSGTGRLAGSGEERRARGFVEALEGSLGTTVVEAATASGLFLDTDAALRSKITSGAVRDALLDPEAPGRSLLADVVPSYAISFERFC